MKCRENYIIDREEFENHMPIEKEKYV